MYHEKFTKSKTGLIGRILLMGAAVISLYLAAVALTQSTIVGCGDQSDCHEVLQTRWAYLFGIPASFPGIAIYLIAVLAAGAFEAKDQRTWLGLAGQVVMLFITVSAVWFLSIQIFALQKFCIWCVLTHLFALGGVACLTWNRKMQPYAYETSAEWAENHVLRGYGLMSIAHLAAVTAGIVALGLGPFVNPPSLSLHVSKGSDLVQMESSLARNAPSSNVISFGNGKIRFAPTELPLIGESAAGEIAVALTDYTCDYCRLYHNVMEETVRLRGESFAIMLLPATRNDESSSIHQIMLCLFRADPAQHAVLSKQMLAGIHPARSEAVRKSVVGLMGQDAYTKAQNEFGAWAARQIDQTRALRSVNEIITSSMRLPQLMVGNQILVGYYEQPERVNLFIDSCLNPSLTPTSGSSSRPLANRNPLQEEAPLQPLSKELPQLSPSLNIQNLGLFEAGKSRTCEVEFTNPNPTPMKVSWVGLDAGCELVSFPDDAIPQGGRASVTLTIVAPEKTDIFSRQIRIHTDVPSPLVLELQGRVAPPSEDVSSTPNATVYTR